MNPKRSRWIAIAIVLTIVVLGISLSTNSSDYAYRACRAVMLNEDGYGVWTLKSSRFSFVKAQYDFFDGYNTTTCEASGFGTHWVGSKGLETLVACMLSLDETGGNECPRKKYGVSP